MSKIAMAFLLLLVACDPRTHEEQMRANTKSGMDWCIARCSAVDAGSAVYGNSHCFCQVPLR